MQKNYIDINRESWNKRTEVHIHSEFYDNDSFVKGRNSLNDIELSLLGDLKGKSVLHLQCHFGQDTISLNRMGAKVTGVDFSDRAIEEARKLVEKTNSDANFICSDVYELPLVHQEKYDLVFTSYGTIGWLPDMNKWAEIISFYLKPGGRFVFAEFHPFVWMFDQDFKEIKYNYSNDGPIIENESGTYADKFSSLNQEYISWNHSISSVINALIRSNIEIVQLDEIDYSPYNCFNQTIEVSPGKFRIKHMGNNIPMVYTLVGIKK